MSLGSLIGFIHNYLGSYLVHLEMLADIGLVDIVVDMDAVFLFAPGYIGL